MKLSQEELNELPDGFEQLQFDSTEKELVEYFMENPELAFNLDELQNQVRMASLPGLKILRDAEIIAQDGNFYYLKKTDYAEKYLDMV